MYTYLRAETDIAQNLIVDFFSSFVGGPFRRKNFKRKKIWGYGVKFWKKKQALYVEFNEEVEAATNSYYAKGDFLQYAYSVLVAKSHNKIRSRCLVHEFFFHRYFLTILNMVTEQLY